MKRAFVLLIVFAIFFSGTAYADIIFQDDFESYIVGSWPTSYTQSGNGSDTQVLADPTDPNNQVLHLWSQSGWGSIVHHDVAFTNDFSLSFQGYMETGGLQVMLKSYPHWHWDYSYANLLRVTPTGEFLIMDNLITTIDPNKWHEYTLESQREGADITSSYYIDGFFIGSYSVAVRNDSGLTPDATLGYLTLANGGWISGHAYFDDIVITSSSPDPVPGPTTMLLLGTGLLGLAGARRRMKS